ncbi:MAG TPA: MmcQ/YjbR family DNA-binding protein [Candidatus Saccharimonadaceae bacterium]|mgnify:CR=1 FL=1|nr:MmcQ/YjbR family DNA-binding protein [Candidatus Saccharimonadaceae bacterium]|tara:strand:+ start:545 stop:883 length:339 start_codon:yes stop_codon:yes gene_type:complete
MTHKELEDYLLEFPNTWLDFPFGEGVSVYKAGNLETKEGKLFAIIADKSKPLRVSLKCDPVLAQTLREKYESVLPGYHLNKKHWNTIIMTGQLDDEEVKDLARLSYRLVTER